MVRVGVKPELLKWAIDRSGLDRAALSRKFPQLDSWLAESSSPTLKQLGNFANTVHAPVGYLFLPTPPVETLPIADLRTVGSGGVRRPSPDLLDVIHACQRRQDWYRDYAEQAGEPIREFVGTASPGSDSVEVAGRMQRTLGFGVGERRDCADHEEAFRRFVSKAEAAGVLVMVSGIVGQNTSRKLDPKEFRGFALADRLAPLVFVNGTDSKSAKMFTLAHELAHLWLGESALSDAALKTSRSASRTESWCNEVAAEFLVPLRELENLAFGDPVAHLRVVAHDFKVSTLVVLRRLLDAGIIDRERFRVCYAEEVRRIKAAKPAQGGSNSYATLKRRLGDRFTRAVVESTLAGETLYSDAFRLLGIGGSKVFDGLGKNLGLV